MPAVAELMLSHAELFLSADWRFLGRKVAPSFDKVDMTLASNSVSGGVGGERSEVYALFLQYEGWKRVFCAYDVMDAVHHIYREVRRTGYHGDSIDEVR